MAKHVHMWNNFWLNDTMVIELSEYNLNLMIKASDEKNTNLLKEDPTFNKI